ncbi:hypothetical protein CQA66_06785 [Helicobacter aurati]|uniref:Uncharacterized protein n=1 Tax=Helicobacter aurati TaxID=137778 RepID=A0A3D8J272_9HELI|nr:hypothetical protein [Helicobacter aurati]RDU71245.1 hypothetical protein CQA66_06785 [Helicobacter aurati]
MLLHKWVKPVLIVWSIVFLIASSAWLICGLLSKQRIYEANIKVINIAVDGSSLESHSSDIESNVLSYRYTLKLLFPSKIFRPQKNISNIEVTSIQFNNTICEYNNHAISSLDICRNLVFSSNQRTIEWTTQEVLNQDAIVGNVKYKVSFPLRTFLSFSVYYLLGVFLILSCSYLLSCVDKRTTPYIYIYISDIPKPTLFHLIACSLSLFGMLMCYMFIDNGHDWGGDFSAYIHQALSIMQGKVAEYKLENAFIIDNTHHFTSTLYGPPTYPWGLPLLFVPFLYLFGLNFFGLKLIMVCHFGMFLIALYYFLCKRLYYLTACVIVLFFACNPNLLWFSNSLVSDFPFMAWCIVAIALLDSFLRSASQSLFLLVVKVLLAGFAMFIAIAMRTNGLVLPLTLVCYYILLLIQMKFAILQSLSNPYVSLMGFPYLNKHRSVIVLIFLLPLIVCGLLELALSLWLGFGNSGNTHFLQFAIFHNIAMFFTFLCQCAFIFGAVKIIVGIVSIPFVCIAIYHLWAKEAFCLIFCLGYLCLYSLWINIGERAILPLVPFYVYFFVVGVFFAKRIKMVFITFILAVMLIGYHIFVDAKRIINNMPRISNYGSTSDDSIQMYHYIKEHTPKESVIIFIKPRVLHLFTQRLSFAAFDLNEENMQKADYVVMAKDFGWTPSIKNDSMSDKVINRRLLELQYSNNSFKVFRINHSLLQR